MEKPLLDWVVVEGSVNVNRAHASEGDTLVCQQLFSVQLALQKSGDTVYPGQSTTYESKMHHNKPQHEPSNSTIRFTE